LSTTFPRNTLTTIDVLAPRGLRIDDLLDHDISRHLESATVDTFISILASEAGNLALKVLATGGIYLAGGVPLHMVSALKRPRFIWAGKF
jgi:glucokinase